MSRSTGRTIAILGGCFASIVGGVLLLSYRQEIVLWYRFGATIRELKENKSFTYLGTNAQGFLGYRHKLSDIVMVLLPGGRFSMGRTEDEIDAYAKEFTDRAPKVKESLLATEHPQHTVTLSPFLIAKYPVTQANWTRIMGNNPSRVKGGELAVETVSWKDCEEFCRKTFLDTPTEARWEYARGGRQRYKPTSPGRSLHEAVPHQPNVYGLHGIQGSFIEWCQDVYDQDFYTRPEASGRDPVSNSGSVKRVGRGSIGGRRYGYGPDVRSDAFTFRPAYSLRPRR